MKVIFLDRDGVINEDSGYVFEKDNFKFIKGIFDSCRYFQSIGFEIIVVTNQSGIGRGYYTKEDFCALTRWMLACFAKKNIEILDVFFCPHAPKSLCDCRKPKPGLFVKARNKHNINMRNSWMIGDKESDIFAANGAGIKNTILLRSDAEINLHLTRASLVLDSIEACRRVIR